MLLFLHTPLNSSGKSLPVTLHFATSVDLMQQLHQMLQYFVHHHLLHFMIRFSFSSSWFHVAAMIYFILASQLSIPCSKLTKEILEQCVKYVQRQQQKHQNDWCRSCVFIVNFEHVSHIVLVFQFLTLSR